MGMYHTVNEAVEALNNILDEFTGRSCIFDVGCMIVDDIVSYTPFITYNWGVYEEPGIVTIYNSDAAVVMQLFGDDNNRIENWKLSLTTIQEMIGL